MTPEEILAELRDIHLPDADPGTMDGTLVLWPLALVLLLLAALAFLAWRRRTIWRRDAVRALAEIERDADSADPAEAWASLALLLRRLTLQRADRAEVAGLSGEPWLERLDQLFGDGDHFTKGSGRGLITYPYRVIAPGDPAGKTSDELRATIAMVKKKLPVLGTPR